MDENVVVVTGASSGIGEATSELLAGGGMSVLLVARRADALEKVSARCNGRGVPVAADVSRRHEVERVLTLALSRFGQVDVWINNVGRGISRMPSELTDEDVDEVMRQNVMPALYGMQTVLPHFKSRGRGHIINISSLLGRIPFATVRSAYCGAKHFLNALTTTFREEVQQTHPDIQFSLVSPGVVRTDFGLHALHGGVDSRQLPYSQSAEEVAAVIAGVIKSREPDVYTLPGAHDRVASYYALLGVDASPGH